MILTVHILTGAALASKIQTIPLALLLAFSSHYFLDFLPHDEYLIENIREKKWRKSFPDFLKISADAFFGLLLVFILTLSRQPIIYLAAFLAILPDFFLLLNLSLPKKSKLLSRNEYLHEKTHLYPEKKKKISFFWRLLVQLAVFIAACLILAS